MTGTRTQRCEASLVSYILLMATVVTIAIAKELGSGPMLKLKSVNRQALPEFTVVPNAEYYLLKAKVLTLTCRARHASFIQVTCGGEVLSPTQVYTRQFDPARIGATVTRPSVVPETLQDDVLDLETTATATATDLDGSVLATEVQWNVTFDSVFEYGGIVDQPDYICECTAWREHRPNILPLRTNQTRILAAVLKRNFQQQPIHMTVTEGRQVELACMPPEGKPTPEISWLKNGTPIDPHKDGNVLIGGYGSLMINQARVTDTGLYTCIAQNIAGKRSSEAANLTVTVNGHWSDWTPWNPATCSLKCTAVPVMQMRSRQCIEPKNGGTPCSGSNIDQRPCPSGCPINGGWGKWSDWEQAKCDKNCKQYRERVCDSPAPARGGYPCEGANREERVCDGCIVSTEALRAVGAPPVDIQTLLLYVAVACGIAIIFAAVGSIYILRKRRLHATADSFTLYNEDRPAKHVPCIAFRKSARTKEQHSSEMQTQSVRLLHSNQEMTRSQATINLSVTPTRSELAQLSTSSFQQPESGRSTTYLTSLTPTRSIAIASTQMPIHSVQQSSISQPFTIDTKLAQGLSEVKVHSGYSSPHTYQSLSGMQPSINSATLSLPPPPPNVTNTPQACALQVPAQRVAAAPLTTNMVNYHDRIMMNSYILRPSGNACESTETCASVNERTSCDEDATSRATPYCATSQCESASCACACELDDALYGEAGDGHAYASFLEVLKNGCNHANRFAAEQPPTALSTSQYAAQLRNVPQKRSSALFANDSFKSARSPVSVSVPDGALLPACASIGVATIHDEVERPHLRNERQTFLSAVTQLRCTSGHRAVTLVKTVVLSFPHCATLSDEWQYYLYFTHDHIGDAQMQTAATWHCVPVDRENGCAQINESGTVICCHLDANRCYVVTNRLGRYALLGEPIENGGATKMLRLAAFSTKLNASAYEHTVRVYILDDTFDAFHNVMDAERTLGGCLLDSPKQLAFKHALQQNLRVQVETLSLGWRAKSRVANCQQEIPFSHIWAGTQTRLHCSFMFERCGKAEEVGSKFLCKLTACQSEGQPTALNVIQECNSIADESRNVSRPCATATDSFERSVASFSSQQPIFSATARRKLSAMLDDNDCIPNWKELAMQLGIGGLIAEQLATLNDTFSPAETLLSVFEAKCVGTLSRDESLQEMIGLLRRMKRPDCAVVLENDLSNKF